MPGVMHRLDRSPGSAAASRRAMISISGSSGTSVHVSLRRAWTRGSRRRRRRSRRRAPRELEALVAVSSPVRRRPRRERVRVGVRRAAARRGGGRARARAPRPTTPRTSSPACTAPARGKVLLVGHIDTVVAHAEHKPLTRVGEQLVGSGTRRHEGRRRSSSIGALRAFAKRPELYAELALLLVCDEEWRTADFAPRRALRGLRRLPVLRGRRDGGRRRGRRRPAQGGGHDPRHRRTAAAPTPAPRPTAAATRCSRSPRPPRPSPPTTIRAGRRT